MKKPKLIGDRYYGLTHCYLTVSQGGGPVIVDSAHRSPLRAWKRARELAKKGGKVVGVLTTYGSTTKLYKRGDVVDMRHDIHFAKVPGCCSTCCHPFVNPPFSLVHVCHIGVDRLTGDETCNAVKAVTIYLKRAT